MISIVALALLVGLGLVVAVKYSGLLNPPEKKVEATPPPPAPPPPPLVVVAVRESVRRRRHQPLGCEAPADHRGGSPRLPEEHVQLFVGRARSRLLPHALKNIEANHPITKDLLEPMAKPEPLHSRLPLLTCAIDLQVAVENSAAGLIQVEDWVDVYLTSDVGRTDGGQSSVRNALLARNVQVIAKRGTLYRTYAPLPAGPIQFTLAANLYRAALIDYARNKGVISLHPVSRAEKEKLDALKAGVGEEPDKVVALSLSPDSEEYAAELARVHAHDRGEATIGDEDLLRLFSLTPPTPPSSTTIVEYFSGARRTGGAAFVQLDGHMQPYTPADKLANYTFLPPKADPRK